MQVGESYNRAYKVVVKVQQLVEMEEVIEYKSTDVEERKSMIRNIWTKRLRGCQRNVEVWQARPVPGTTCFACSQLVRAARTADLARLRLVVTRHTHRTCWRSILWSFRPSRTSTTGSSSRASAARAGA
jgi:hypothetical protein